MQQDLSTIFKVIKTSQTERFAVSSKDVAERFGKEHFHVLRDIRNLCKHLPSDFASANFGWNKIKVLSSKNEEVTEVFMTRDGFALLAMGFTGKAALQWKVQFIKAFNQLEEVALLALKEEKASAEQFRIAVNAQLARADEFIGYLTKDIQTLQANQKKSRKTSKPRLLNMPSMHVDLFGKLAFTWAYKLTKQEADFWQVRICSVVHMMLTREGLKRKAQEEVVQAMKDFRAQFKNSALQVTDEDLISMISGVIAEGIEKMSRHSTTTKKLA